MFKDREDAALQLLPQLKQYRGDPEAILLAIPRGALEMGAVLRKELDLPLDIVVTKKIGAPGNEEFAIGAVSPDGSVHLNETVIASYSVPKSYIQKESEGLKKAIQARYERYRGSSKAPELKGKTVIVIDDGIATGFTTLTAVQYIRSQAPKKIVLAVPVAAPDSAEKLKKEVDEWVCLDMPADFHAVAQFYQHFPQVSDEEAIELLRSKAV